ERSARVVEDLPRNGVEVEPGTEPPELSQLERQEIEEERPVDLGRERNHLAPRFLRNARVNVLKVGCLAAKAGAVIDDLAVDFARRVVDQRHVARGLLFFE